jgi:hypothetical protein
MTKQHSPVLRSSTLIAMTAYFENESTPGIMCLQAPIALRLNSSIQSKMEHVLYAFDR